MVEECEGLIILSVQGRRNDRKGKSHTLAMLIQAGSKRRGSSEPPDK